MISIIRPAIILGHPSANNPDTFAGRRLEKLLKFLDNKYLKRLFANYKEFRHPGLRFTMSHRKQAHTRFPLDVAGA
jgi:transcriptional regulator of aromatic amino acid metabolism